jgi:hypothetical protein
MITPDKLNFKDEWEKSIHLVVEGGQILGLGRVDERMALIVACKDGQTREVALYANDLIDYAFAPADE